MRALWLSAVLMGPSILLLFAHITPWPFRILAVVPVTACLEELTMTTLLPNWHANIPSLRQALKLKRELYGKDESHAGTGTNPPNGKTAS